MPPVGLSHNDPTIRGCHLLERVQCPSMPPPNPTCTDAGHQIKALWGLWHILGPVHLQEMELGIRNTFLMLLMDIGNAVGRNQLLSLSSVGTALQA